MKRSILVVLTLCLTISVSELKAFDLRSFINSEEIIDNLITNKKDKKTFENIKSIVNIGKPKKQINYNGESVNSEYESSDDRKTKNQAVAIYTAGGAALGGAIGQIAGKDTKSTLLGIGIGGVIGSFYGKGEGEKAVSEKNRIANKREALQHEIKQVKKVNSEARKYNKRLRSEIYRLKRLSKADLERNLKKAKEKYIEAKGLCRMAKMKLSELKTLKTKTKDAMLNAQIKKLKYEIATLEKQTDQLASIDKRIRV